MPLAAYQVTATIWTFLAFALDALAIAAQAITGRALGAGDVDAHPRRDVLMLRWGVVGRRRARRRCCSCCGPVLGPLFTPDPAVQAAIAGGLVVVALGQPLSGFVFVVDGVLIGAGDGRWLARAMLVTLVGLPARHPRRARRRATGCSRAAPPAGQVDAVDLAVDRLHRFMSVRGTLMWMRVRTDRWMVTGAIRT